MPGKAHRIAVVFLALLCGVAFCGYVAYETFGKPPIKPSLSSQPCTGPATIDFSERVPVALNRGPEVLDGFQGEVHPILQPHGGLEVKAYWDFNRNGRFLLATPDFRPL